MQRAAPRVPARDTLTAPGDRDAKTCTKTRAQADQVTLSCLSPTCSFCLYLGDDESDGDNGGVVGGGDIPYWCLVMMKENYK